MMHYTSYTLLTSLSSEQAQPDEVHIVDVSCFHAVFMPWQTAVHVHATVRETITRKPNGLAIRHKPALARSKFARVLYLH